MIDYPCYILLFDIKRICFLNEKRLLIILGDEISRRVLQYTSHGYGINNDDDHGNKNTVC